MAIDRQALYKRCKGNCERCGGVLPENWAAHHRKLRSQGGKDSLDNVVALHHECHNLATDSVHLNPKNAYNFGFMVHSWESSEEVLISIPFVGIVRLTPEGTYENTNSIT
jgi:hypothetical protein